MGSQGGGEGEGWREEDGRASGLGLAVCSFGEGEARREEMG